MKESVPERCAKCGKVLWAYLVRTNFPWQKPTTEKWCFNCATGCLFMTKKGADNG